MLGLDLASQCIATALGATSVERILANSLASFLNLKLRGEVQRN